MNTDGTEAPQQNDGKPGIRLGRLLRDKRHSLGMTQKQLEARSGGVLSQNYISLIERGEVELPGFKMLEAFAVALGLDLNELKIVAGYPAVYVRSGVESGTRIKVKVDKTPEYYGQLAAQALEELAPDDWEVIEAMLERRKQERQRKE